MAGTAAALTTARDLSLATTTALAKIKALHATRLREKEELQSRLQEEESKLNEERSAIYDTWLPRVGRYARARTKTTKELASAAAQVQMLREQEADVEEAEERLEQLKTEIQAIEEAIGKARAEIPTATVPQARDIDNAFQTLTEQLTDSPAALQHLQLIRRAFVDVAQQDELKRLQDELTECNARIATTAATTLPPREEEEGEEEKVLAAPHKPGISFGDIQFIGRIRARQSPTEAILPYQKLKHTVSALDKRENKWISVEKIELEVKTGLITQGTVEFYFDFLLDDLVSPSDGPIIKQEQFLNVVRQAIIPVLLPTRGMDAKNVIFITYGVSGTGKSWSLFGNGADIPGAIGSLMEHIFNDVGRLASVHFWEIYNGKRNDALLTVRQPLKNVTEAKFNASLAQAESQRVKGRTPLNPQSSRSHFVMEAQLVEGGPSFVVIDMAGAETLKQPELRPLYEGKKGREEELSKRLEESLEINKSIVRLEAFYSWFGIASQPGGGSTKRRAAAASTSQKKTVCTERTVFPTHLFREWSFLNEYTGQWGENKAKTVFLQTLALTTTMAPRLIPQQSFNNGLAGLVLCTK